MYYLICNMRTRAAKGGLLAAILLCALASLGSYSRGAALAIGAMTVVLWLKSQNKAQLAVHAAHSIYFQVLGGYGWIGWALYLALGVMVWRAAARSCWFVGVIAGRR